MPSTRLCIIAVILAFELGCGLRTGIADTLPPTDGIGSADDAEAGTEDGESGVVSLCPPDQVPCLGCKGEVTCVDPAVCPPAPECPAAGP
jgi:hypothetical protein